MFLKEFKISSLFFGTFLLLMTTFSLKAQEKTDHFIYIQSETKQPFYVILNNKNYSSSSIGYLIIPKLRDGKYSIKLGFPKDAYPEQNFTCVVDKADVGYSLHNKNDQEWSLLNLQTQESIAAGSASTQSTDAGSNQPSAFGNMLSDASNDPTITQKTPEIVKKPVVEEPKKEEVAPEVQAAVAAPPVVQKAKGKKHTRTSDTDAANNAPAETSSTSTAASQDYSSGVVKSYEKKVKGGTEMAFVSYDNSNPDGDSVKIFIPSTAVSAKPAPSVPAKKKDQSLGVLDTMDESGANVDQQSSSVATNQGISTDVASGSDKKKVNNPFYNKKNKRTDNTDNSNSSQSSTSAVNATVNSNCTNSLSDDDLPALRKRMVSKDNDEDMIATAKKYLKGKCVTTDQLKSLGGLFLSDSGRYGLFEALYNQVYDTGNYPTLQSQLFDKYYINRFKALIGQ